MTIKEYIAELDRQFRTGQAREHSYRPALQNLLATMLPQLTVTNEPARQACGAPDFILQRQQTNVPVAFVEAKDLDDSDLKGSKRNKEQFDRYKHSLDNIIFTDNLDFLLYEKGEFVDSVRIAELRGGKIVALPENAEKFESLIKHFGDAQPQRITSSSKLAEIMAGKARLLAAVIEKTIETSEDENSLTAQMEAFKEVLIHTITPKEFADVYAQTIAYGMFAARLHDTSPDTFSRQEAATLIPKTNPFLRQLFQYIAGYDLDERISWIVDDLAESFRATDIQAVMSGFGKRTQQTDPMIHFYENFLTAYDPALRKSRGVWYTPQAVVNFIVRAVDEILQTEFSLPMGLADTSKTTMKVANQKSKKNQPDTYNIDVHRVQILDPATGTGTFLAEAVSQIHAKMQGQQGMWQGYVEEHLIPRLNGFELLMASYTMAHLKLDMLLADTGYKHTAANQRLRVFLTNSLEEYSSEANKLGLYKWLADEGNEADKIKRDTPVMVVMGNPPYSVSSSNKGKWIQNMLVDYKKGLNERKINLDDDYIKFIRYGQHFVDKNGEGVLAYITNNSFIDGITHRQMRKSLLQTFDKVYIVDLHGNAKKKEICPDGTPDQNVFDIMQGVSINIFVKNGKKVSGELAEVYHYDLWGKRDSKYQFLLSNSLSGVKWNKIGYTEPYYFFVPKDFSLSAGYENGFKIDELMIKNSNGVETKCDELTIGFDKTKLDNIINDFKNHEVTYLKNKYNKSDSSGWTILSAKESLIHNTYYEQVIQYRPFDYRHTIISKKSGGFIGRSRFEIMRHFINSDNTGLIIPRQTTQDWRHCFVTRHIIDGNITASAKLFGSGNLFPLYLYPETPELGGSTRIPNLDPTIVARFAERMNFCFVEDDNILVDLAAGCDGALYPIDLLDYIYAVLHSPAYREKYKEFLKIDFPRVPYPDGESPKERAENFHRLASIGSELRKLHLMEHPALQTLITTYPTAGNNTVDKPRFEETPSREEGDGSQDGVVLPLIENAEVAQEVQVGKVWINETQYFDNVPLAAWNFYIGGYQPAQKWLKDRKSLTLTYEDTLHYQRVIVALTMTEELMNKI